MTDDNADTTGTFDARDIARQVKEGRDYSPEVQAAVDAVRGKGANSARKIADEINLNRGGF